MPITCMPLADYPTLPKHQADDTISIERAVLVAMLGRVATAVSSDKALQVLTCVQAELSGGALTLATTDRFRLAVTTVHGVADIADTGAWLLPCTTLAQIVKALPDGPVTVSVDPTTPDQVTVRGGHIVSTIRLIDAEFPRFRQLMPDTYTTATIVDRAALHKAVGKAHALCKALNTRMDVITVAITGDDVTVAPRVADRADAVHGQRIDANGSGTPMMFSVNAVYLAEALASFTGDTVALGLNNPNKPIMIAEDVVSLGTSNTAHRHLVMPTRLPAQG